MDLTPKDQRHLESAQGWLALGNHVEANRELQEIDPACRIYPDVLELRWQVLAKAGTWVLCLDVANVLTRLAPGRAFGWYHKAVSLDQLGRTAEAIEVLENCGAGFTMDTSFPYALATFYAKLGRIDDARDYVAMAAAVAVDDEETTRIMAKALADPTLEALWQDG